MAISQPTTSVQYRDLAAAPARDIPAGNPLLELSGDLTFASAGFTSAASGDLSLLRLPAGRLRIRLDRSAIICPQGTATSDLDIGLGAYTDAATKATVEADGDALAASLDVGGAALDQKLGNGSVVVDSLTGVTVVASFDTANSPASGTLRLSIVYQLG